MELQNEARVAYFTQQNQLLAVLRRGEAEGPDMVNVTIRNGKFFHLLLNLSVHAFEDSFATIPLLYQFEHALVQPISHSSVMSCRSSLASLIFCLAALFLQCAPNLVVQWVFVRTIMWPHILWEEV